MSIQKSVDGFGLVTDSPLRAWWLKRIRRYTVINVRLSPKVGFFGGITYESIWTFEKSGAG